MSGTTRRRMRSILRSYRRHKRYVWGFAALAALTAVVVALSLRQQGNAQIRTEKVLDCPVTGMVAHTHDGSCYDTDGNLVCTLPESELHVHDDSCYTEERVLTCGLEEDEGHVHTDECYEVVRTLTCGQDEVTETHVHGAGCFETMMVDDGESGAVQEEITQVAPPAESSAVSQEDPTLAETHPAQTFKHLFKDADDNLVLRVDVQAPVGALPKGTTMVATWVDTEQLADDEQAALDKALADKADGQVLQMQAVDISFRNAVGAEVEPATDVTVTMTSGLVDTDDQAVVVHIEDDKQMKERKGDEREAQVVDTLSDSELKRRKVSLADNQLSFDSDQFSTYVLAVTSLHKVMQASDGATVTMTVDAPAEAGIPQDAELQVQELAEGSRKYVTYSERAAEALGVSDGLAYARLFDISIVVDGQEVQPAEPVAVQIELADIDAAVNPAVVHFGENPEIIEAVTDGQVVSFEAGSFSIYAVVDETKRLKYVFHNGSNIVATEYVKQGESLYDPGIEVDYGQTFIGWAFDQNETNEANVYSISQLNQKLNNETDWANVSDLQEVDVYAITKDAYYLRYMTVDDHENEIVLKTVSVRTDEADKNIEIDYDFTGEEGQTFEGWIDVADGTIYQLGDTLTLDHHIDLYSKVRGRNWLVFDANAGGAGSGATYTPPQLLIGDATTEQPADPTRKGYSFQGWYTNPEGTGAPFQFGSTISEDTVLYAKWAPDNTDYYVIFWRQKASDAAGLPDDQKQYDYIESVQRSALTDGTVTLQNADKNKRTGDYENCTFNEDLSDAQKTVNADGTTTLNVYYDRNEYTLTFQVQGNYHYEYTPTDSNSGTQYGLVDGQYIQLTRGGSNPNYTWTYPTGEYTYTATTGNSGTQYGLVNGEYVELYRSWGNWYYGYGNRYNGTRYTRTEETETYTGTRYTSVYTNWTTIHTITALYDSDIHDKWSFIGSNGVTYPTTSPNTSWTPQNSSTYTARITSMQRMPGENIVFHWTSSNNTTRYFHYYVEALPEDAGTRTYNGTDYVLRLEQPNDFNIVYYNDDFWLLEGFTRQTITKSNDQTVNLSAGGNVNWSTLNNNYGGDDNHLYFYYTRNKYTIHYISQGPNVTSRTEKQDDRVYYEASLEPYGMQEDGSWYYEPTNGKDGYYFAGWYEDEGCTVPYDFDAQMPANDVTVYAKWDTQRVRVVLVPTKDNAHNDEVQMANNQVLSFRLDYKETVSDENIKSGVIKRTGYRLVGWYTSPTFEEDTLWNFSTEVSKEVPAVDMNYQSSTNSDWVNNTYGDNDGAHDNVRGILKLYAKWELTVDENSVYVEYDVPEEYRTYDSQGNLQTTIPVDETAYVLTDQNITATIKEAPTNYADGFKFAGWQLLNSDGSEASDVNPFNAGNTQTIDQRYIEERTITDDMGHTATIKVITLKAKFDIDENNVATMVTFDGNGGVTNDAAQHERVTEAVQVNKTFDIPASGDYVREGYTQVGWSFDPEMTAEGFRELVEQHTSGEVVDYDALAHLGVFEMGQTVAADNNFLTEINNWEPLANTIYAIWEPHEFTVTVTKVVDGETATDKQFGFTAEGLSDNASDTAFSLVNGATKTVSGVPYGTTFTLSESPYAGYSIKSVVAQQTTDSNNVHLDEPIILEGEDRKTYTVKGDIEITYTNERAAVPVKVVKVDQEGHALAGATFEGDLLDGPVTTSVTGTGEDAEAIIVDDDAVSLGTYVLTETNPPAGFNSLPGSVSIKVESLPTGYIKVTPTINGEESGYATAEPVDRAHPERGWIVTIMNSAGVELPSAGGVGTWPMTLAGIAMILGAAGYLLLGTKRQA